MSVYDQWNKIDLSPPKSSIDHARFSGFMKNPEYLKYLQKELLNPQVFIEITSRCNFFCSYCHSPKSRRPKGTMGEDLFRHIAKQLPGFTDRPVALHVDGEPTIHPLFETYVKILNSYGHRVGLASNGSTLQPSFHGLRMDFSSYISTSEEEFGKRSNINFAQFNERMVRYLAEWWDNESQQNIDLKVYCPADVANDPDQLREKYDWAASLVAKAGIPNHDIDYGAVNFFSIRKKNGFRLSLTLVAIVAGGLFPETEHYRAPKFSHKSPDFGFCDSPWGRMTIFCDGSVGLCCHGLAGETVYTRPEEIFEKSLKNLWLEHPHVLTFRDNMARGKLILPGCKLCLSRYPLREFYVKNGTFVPEVDVILGENLDFQGDGKRALVFGFMKDVDGNGNLWTIANRPLFGFRISTPGGGLPELMAIEIEATGFAPEEMGNDQYVDVSVNNAKIKRWILKHSASEKYYAVFSRNLLRNGEAMFALRFTERRSPEELKLGPDRRKLGLGISRITIAEAS